MVRTPSHGGQHNELAEAVSLVLDLGVAITSSLDVDQALQTVAGRIAQAFGVWECDFYDYRPELDLYRSIAVWTEVPTQADRDFIGQVFHLDERPSYRRLIAERRPHLDLLSDPDLDPVQALIMRDWGERSKLWVPLLIHDEVVGFMTLVEKRSERRYGPRDYERLKLIVTPAALAVQQARASRRAEEKQRRLAALLDSTRAISSTMVLDEVLRLVAQHTAQAVGAPVCILYEYERPSNCLVLRSRYGQASLRCRDPLGARQPLAAVSAAGPMLAGCAAYAERLSDPALAPAARAALQGWGEESVLSLPLTVEGETLGFLSVIETAEEWRFSQEEVALLSAFAEQAAVAIRHARLYATHEEQAISDGLTGLANHRHFYERLHDEVARAQRYRLPLSLLMLDLDDFKNFNDLYGHQNGDRALQLVGAVLRERLRAKIDLAARYGGDEFAVLLPNTAIAGATTAAARLAAEISHLGKARESSAGDGHPEGAAAVAERLRRGIAEAATKPSVLPTPITVSIGVAELVTDRDGERLVSAADQALYQAKQSGKSRFCLASQRSDHRHGGRS